MSHSIRACLLLIVPALLTSAVVAQQSPDRYIEKARKCIKKKDYSCAEQQLKRAYEIKPDSAEVNLMLAVVFRHKRQPDVAIKYAEDSLKYQVEYADAHYILALLYNDKRETEAAYREIETAFAQGARSTNVYFLKGLLLLMKKEYRAAIEPFEEVLKQSKGEEANRRKGYIENLKRHTEFEENVQAMARKDPDIKRPVPINRPRPGYTEEARKNKEMGTVHLVARIDEQGKVTTVLILSGLRFGLDKAAEKAASQMIFSPATTGGKPIPFWMPMEVEFNLRD